MGIIVDCIILGILIAAFISGFAKGMTQQAFSLGGLILGIVLGTLLYKPFASFLQDTISLSERPACIVSFLIILIIVPVICGWVGKILSRVIHTASLGFFDRLLGAFFGLFISLLFMGLTIKFLDMTGVSDEIVRNGDRKQSKLYGPVSNITGFCLQWTWNKVEDGLEDIIPDLKDRKEKKGDDNSDKSEQQKV